MSRTTPRRIVRNTVVNGVSYLFLMISSFVLVPIIVGTLGTEVYGGIWVTVGVLTAYMGLVDLGTGTAFVKYIAEFFTRDDEESLSRVVNTGMAMYATVGVIMLGIAWLFGRDAMALAGVPSSLLDDGVFVLRVGVVVFVVTNMFSPMTSVLTGIQRLDVQAGVAMGVQTCNIAGTLLVVAHHWGVRGLMLNNLAVALLNALAMGFAALRFMPGIRFGVRYCRLDMARRFLAYGMNLQISKIAQVILFQTDRILSLRFFGYATAALYDIGARLNGAARAFSLLSVSAAVPVVSELQALHDRERLLGLYRRTTKYVAIVTSTIFAFVAFFAKDILVTWMGTGFIASAPIVIALALGYYGNALTGVASSLSAGVGKTEFDRRYGIMAAPVNIAATLSGAWLFGAVGIAIGTSAALVLSGVYFMALVHRYLDVSLRTIAGLILRPLASAVCAATVVLLAKTLLGLEAASRWQGMLILAGVFAGYIVLLLIALRWTRSIDATDVSLVRSIIRKET